MSDDPSPPRPPSTEDAAATEADQVRRRITMFVQPRTKLETGTEPRRVLFVGVNPRECATLEEMLNDAVNPEFTLEHAADETLAIEMLVQRSFDVVLVELDRDRKIWTRLVRDRRLPNVPLIVVDHRGDAGERSLKRAQLIKEGASGYVRRGELSGARFTDLGDDQRPRSGRNTLRVARPRRPQDRGTNQKGTQFQQGRQRTPRSRAG